MKALMLVLCVVGMLFLAGCSDTANIDTGGNASNGNNGGNNGGGGGGGNANNLQTFVVSNCNGVTGGDPMDVNGTSFPANDTTDPTQSVYTKNCLGG